MATILKNGEQGHNILRANKKMKVYKHIHNQDKNITLTNKEVEMLDTITTQDKKYRHALRALRYRLGNSDDR